MGIEALKVNTSYTEFRCVESETVGISTLKNHVQLFLCVLSKVDSV